MKLLSFRYNDLSINYQTLHQLGVAENYLFDIYRSKYVKSGDLVLDVGAGIGDFAVLASKKVGNNGKVIAIEPNVDDYQIMKVNLSNNKCTNVLPINMGVAAAKGVKKITFADRAFEFKTDTIENILNELGVDKKINFIKMDIEGFEKEVVAHSLDSIKNADVISIEMHGTHKEISNLLLPQGFIFRRITRSFIYMKIIQQLFTHPRLLYRMYRDIKKSNPDLAVKVASGIEITKEGGGLVVGAYVKI